MPWLPWPFGQSPSPKNEQKATPVAPPAETKGTWLRPLNKSDPGHYTSTQTLVFGVLTSAATLALYSLYKNHLRRIPGADYLKPSFFRRRSLYGYVTSVGDGDNFRLFHTPGGRLMGWGWLRQIGKQSVNKNGKKRIGGTEGTLHVRIAGVDAPECAHFGRPEQPYSKEALEWLRGFLHQRHVRVYPYRRDQYDRIVCTVVRTRWLVWKQDVGLTMLKRGLATVYEAKFGSEFGGSEEAYREAETKAKSKKVGMWQEPGLVAKMLGQTSKTLESPREYKTRMAKSEASDTPAQKTKT
jgi:endonuclease YncB( thermonuclease family)